MSYFIDSRAVKFLEMHDNGLSYRAIGALEGISGERVRQVIRAYIGEGDRMKPAPTKVAERRARSRPVRGVSLLKASELLGCSMHMARKLNDEGFIHASKGKRSAPPKRLNEISELAELGYTLREIAHKLNVSEPYISIMCKKHSIKFIDGRMKRKANV